MVEEFVLPLDRRLTIFSSVKRMTCFTRFERLICSWLTFFMLTQPVFAAIGCRSPLPAVSGRIDEITVYDRVLTLAEIASIHAAGSIGKCRPTNNYPPQVAIYGDAEFIARGQATLDAIVLDDGLPGLWSIPMATN